MFLQLHITILFSHNQTWKQFLHKDELKHIYVHRFIFLVHIQQCWEPFQISLPSEYRVPSKCIRLTSDYNLFFIFVVEQDTFKGVILKNIHIMTDKYNCSQIQAIIQSFDKVVHHTCTVVFCKLMLWSSSIGG